MYFSANTKSTQMVKHLNIEFTQKPVISWSGLKLMKELVDKTEIRDTFMRLTCHILNQTGAMIR